MGYSAVPGMVRDRRWWWQAGHPSRQAGMVVVVIAGPVHPTGRDRW